MKKLLALVLALVMTMSLVTISNAAFKDAESIDYKEAVDVMNAAGVLIGDEKGNFNAKAELTRAQAAKIVAYLDLGGKTADAIKGAGTAFSDVPATHWAAGYVEYCAGAGYVAGMGDKTFAPNEKVTGVQFAKMLLCALGYKANIEGYVGTDYTIAIARDANANGLYDNLSIAASAVLTREQAAQMAFNALKADTVKYTGGTEVTTSDGTKVTINAIRGNNEYNAADYRQWIAGTPNREQLCEKLYGQKLKITVAYSDDFGRPANQWQYNGITVGTYAKQPTLTYTGEVKAKQIYADLGNPNLSAVTFRANKDGYVGTNQYGGSYAIDTDTLFVLSDLNKTSSVKGGTHKGTVTEVYFNAADNMLDIVHYNYYLVKAISDYSAKDARVKVELKAGGTGFNKTLANTGYINSDDFAVVEDVKKDDMLVVTLAFDGTNYEVKSVAPATKVENVKVSAARNGDYVTANGTKYEYAYAATKDANFVGYDKMATASNFSLNKDAYNLYLDPNGYVIGVEGFSAKTDISKYAFVTEIGSNAFDKIAKLVFTDGTKKTATIAEIDGYAYSTAADQASFNTQLQVNKFYEFSVKSSGEYELTSLSGKFATKSGTCAGLVNKTMPISNYVANDDTVYLAKGTLFTGVKNAPTAASADSGVGTYALVKDTSILFLYTAASGKSTTNVSSYVYILNGTPALSKDGDDSVYTYAAIVNGEKTEIASNTSNASVGVNEITSYTNGRADLTARTTVANELDTITADGTVKVSGGVLVGSASGSAFAYKIASDCKILTIDGNTVSEISASGVENAYTETFDTLCVFYKATNDPTVVTLYMVK